ncbi:hypothetical protein TNCV_404831 [Trichonephila clavipes]|nr:hypothetical protein TNCV_404831 [Trichonephila clavipes]
MEDDTMWEKGDPGINSEVSGDNGNDESLSKHDTGVPCTRDSALKTFGPTDLPTLYSKGIWGHRTSNIEPKPSGLESDALTTRLPTAPVVEFRG